ncbi:energy-coupling factor transporter transmembrane protein EcfT [Intrasporangium sp.]|uniref:energy-coupling factor transporter transmembrane component T family protein n=1 Tax=Intrasporangium sp. TaxID=1925024 RepID=UPI003221E04C
MTVLATYVERDSPVHRLPAGVKLGGLVVIAALTVFLRDWWQTAALLVLVALLYAAARIPWRAAAAQLRPVALLVAGIGVFQVLVAGWERAVLVCGGITALVALAALVSLTTRTDALVEVVVGLAGPLRRFGVDPERVGLLASLGIRSVPVLVGLAREVRDAQRARGAATRPVAFLAPLMVRSLRHADQVAEALAARGIDD